MVINVDMVDIKSGQTVWISGQHVYVESGVYLASGLYVVADIAESGMGVQIQSGAHVQISGQHVYVESGAYVVADIEIVASSGLLVQISGQHVFVESGAYLASGINVVATVTVDSGLHVWISGQHVFQESGAYIASGIYPASGVGVVVQSGTFAKAIIIGTTGDEAGIDATTNSIIAIAEPHHEIHEGDMWHGYCQTSGLADDATLDLLIVPGSGLEVHAIFEHASEGAAWFELWENVNLSGLPGGSGEPVVAANMNRYVSGAAQTTLYTDPSSVGGNRIDVEYVPGGQGPKTGGGGGRGENEWILNGVSGPINYIVRLINVAGAAKDVQNSIEFYEKTPGY